jgi:hypothetical protein
MTVKITKCPPGKALGAGDLMAWSHNRQLGRTGVSGQGKADLKAWARNRPQPDAADRWLERHDPELQRRLRKRAARRRAAR